jgi:DNA-binding transcriptional regulator YiaG
MFDPVALRAPALTQKAECDAKDRERVIGGCRFRMPETISPAQCRGARGMVGLSQGELADKARVGLSTVKNFETARSVPYAKNMADIIAALEAAGVEFTNGGEPGVKLKRRREPHPVDFGAPRPKPVNTRPKARSRRRGPA